MNALVYDLRIRYHAVRDRARGRFQDSNTGICLVHVPKCAGVSLRHSLNIPNAGHKLLCEYSSEDLARASKIVFCTRDPFDRLSSAFRYLQRVSVARPMLYTALGLPPVTTFDEFVQSDTLPQLEAYHYFFRSQFQYLKGIERYAGKAVHLKFETLEEDFEREFGRPLARMNVGSESPPLENADTPENRKRVRSIYLADYELLPKLLGRD